MATDSGRSAPRAHVGARSAPIAHISRSALRANARILWEQGARSYAPRVLHADAWGHGAAATRATLAEVGLLLDSDAALDPAALFGLPGHSPPLTPVMSLTGTVLATKELRRGEGVSYGYLHRASDDTRIALVTGGYAQGIVRALGGAIEVGDGKQSFAVIGRIAMDVCVVDIGSADIARGSTLTFFGDPARGEPSLEPWVTRSAMTAGEIVSAVGARAVRKDAA